LFVTTRALPTCARLEALQSMDNR